MHYKLLVNICRVLALLFEILSTFQIKFYLDENEIDAFLCNAYAHYLMSIELLKMKKFFFSNIYKKTI